MSKNQRMRILEWRWPECAPLETKRRVAYGLRPVTIIVAVTVVMFVVTLLLALGSCVEL